MPEAMLPFAVLTAVAVVGLLLAESRSWRPGVWLAKPLAAGGFVAAALAAGALDSAYGCWVLLALVLSLCGDVLLIPTEAPAVFRAGILSFLLGHLAFAVAFLVRGVDAVALSAACVAVGIAAILVLRWLSSHLPVGLRIAVYAYLAVISAMLALAAGAWATSGDLRLVLGALMFYVSDLAVARERFVAPSPWNGVWGLPLYFGGQLVLAASVGNL